MTMKRSWIRSTLFNIAFFISSAVCSLAFAPALILPRRWFLGVVWIYHRIIVVLEHTILGLKYEVRGAEHLPESGSYIVAAKHQSPYETLKLRLLFKDPAIVLKKELLSIPLWGLFLKKSDVIAIDRSTPDKAIQSIEDGARRMAQHNRPIVIFPQGTRVTPEATPQEKPYKQGIYRIQKATSLPIIPMATNSGMFWPRSGWLKSSGTAIFEFFPPVPPGKEKQELLNLLRDRIEPASNALMEEALMTQNTQKKRKWPYWTIALTILLLAAGYSAAWFKIAEKVEERYYRISEDLRIEKPAAPVISGFPGPINLDIEQAVVKTPDGVIEVKTLHADRWILPFQTAHVTIGETSLTSFKWDSPLTFDSARADLKLRGHILTITDSLLTKEDFTGAFTGTLDLEQKPVPKPDLNIALKNHASFISDLSRKGVLNKNTALFITTGLTALSDSDGVVHVPLQQRNGRIYAGPIPVMSVPTALKEKQKKKEGKEKPALETEPDFLKSE